MRPLEMNAELGFKDDWNVSDDDYLKELAF